MLPASPQWGRSTNVLKPRSLDGRDIGHVVMSHTYSNILKPRPLDGRDIGHVVMSHTYSNILKPRPLDGRDIGHVVMSHTFSSSPIGDWTLNTQYVNGRTRAQPPVVIQHDHVSEHVVLVVGIGRVVLHCPLLRQRAIPVEHQRLRLRFVIHGVKARHLQRTSSQ